MEKMKLLNDEELEKVSGGKANDYVVTANGRVKINNDAFVIFACHNAFYFIDKATGKPGFEVGNPQCSKCEYCSDDYFCTNPNFIAEVTG